MPYVPSKKTDGKSTDRELIDQKVGLLVEEIVTNTETNFSVLEYYKSVFFGIGCQLIQVETGDKDDLRSPAITGLAATIYDVAKKYNYQGAFLGELNYAITRLIQRVPQTKVGSKQWEGKSELRYWLYAITVEALTFAADKFKDSGIGIGGVFDDIKDEYKRRVNVSYEAAQIIKSGDCYDTPYYTRLVEVRDDNGNLIGHQEIMLKRSDETLNKDVLDGSFVLSSKQLVSNGLSK